MFDPITETGDCLDVCITKLGDVEVMFTFAHNALFFVSYRYEVFGKWDTVLSCLLCCMFCLAILVCGFKLISYAESHVHLGVCVFMMTHCGPPTECGTYSLDDLHASVM